MEDIQWAIDILEWVIIFVCSGIGRVVHLRLKTKILGFSPPTHTNLFFVNIKSIRPFSVSTAKKYQGLP